MYAHIQRYAVSTLTTFVSVFAVTFLTAISAQDFTFTKSAIVATGASAIIAAVRVAAKVIIEYVTGVSGDAPATPL